MRLLYLMELGTQCGFALAAVRHLNFALGRLNTPRTEGGVDFQPEVFRALHSFLTHASNASKILWPPRPRKRRGESKEAYQARKAATRERGEHLRKAVGLTDQSPLRDRTLRDHLEHFDERLNEWEATSVQQNYVQDTIGPQGAISLTDPGDAMRWFDQTTNHYRFRGKSFDMQALATEVDQLLPVAHCAAEAALREWRHWPGSP